MIELLNNEYATRAPVLPETYSLDHLQQYKKKY